MRTYLSILAALVGGLSGGCAHSLCEDRVCESSDASVDTGNEGGEGGTPSGPTPAGGNAGEGNGSEDDGDDQNDDDSTAPTILVPTGNDPTDGGAGGPATSPVDGGGGNTNDLDSSTLDGGPSEAGTGGDAGITPMTGCAQAATDICRGNAPVCDLELDRCVECLLEDDTGCPAGRPYCVGASNDTSACVECEGLSDCSGATPLCSQAGECVGCETQNDCAVFASTPLCRDDGECVSCLTENDCDSSTPACGETGQCEACTDSAECARFDATPACNTQTGACVECAANTDCTDSTAPRCESNTCTACQGAEDCAEFPGLPQCDTGTGQCVECNADTDCSGIYASACQDHQCVPCTEDAQCEHLPGSTVCDAGQCVQCTGLKDDACTVGPDEYVCDSLNRVCAAAVPENLVGSAGSCETCLSDAHCSTGRACVQTEYDDEIVPGWYCQWEVGAPSAPTDCAATGRPYFSTRNDVDSIDGRQDLTVCGLRVSTCTALKDFSSTPCDPDGDVTNQCGEPGLDDGLCRAASPTTDVCTVRCGSDVDCQPGFKCLVGQTPPYCAL